MRVLVLDEADRLLDSTLAPQLADIMALLPSERQTLLFSATMTQSLLQLQKVGATLPLVPKAWLCREDSGPMMHSMLQVHKLCHPPSPSILILRVFSHFHGEPAAGAGGRCHRPIICPINLSRALCTAPVLAAAPHGLCTCAAPVLYLYCACTATVLHLYCTCTGCRPS